MYQPIFTKHAGAEVFFVPFQMVGMCQTLGSYFGIDADWIIIIDNTYYLYIIIIIIQHIVCGMGKVFASRCGKVSGFIKKIANSPLKSGEKLAD